MSLLSKLARSVIRTAGPAITAAAAGFAGGGVGGAAGRILAGGTGSQFLPALPAVIGGAGGAVVRSLPGVGGAILRGGGRVARAGGGLGGAVAGGAVAGAAGQVLVDQFGRPIRRRRRGRGFSARDIRQTRRMLKLIRDMQKAVPRAPGARRAPSVVCK